MIIPRTEGTTICGRLWGWLRTALSLFRRPALSFPFGLQPSRGVVSTRGFLALSMDLRKFSSRGFDRGRPAWFEALWIVVRLTFFETPFPFPSLLKANLLRWFGAKVGQHVVIRPRVYVTFPWRVEIGDFVWLGEGVWILSLDQVKIDSNVCISQQAYLCTGSHDYRSESFNLVTRPINVLSGSWVAARAFVGPGVTIGPNAVVAAGAVVTRDVVAGTLVRGNPAQTKEPPE
jgi:putative colanic acid biosynthesis acetyltransferase WcaF